MKRYNMITKEEIIGKVRILSVEDYVSTVGEWVKHTEVKPLLYQIIDLKEENKVLIRLFELQHKRSLEADKLWQEATGNTHIFPDLGVLLEWLMDQIKKGEE